MRPLRPRRTGYSADVYASEVNPTTKPFRTEIKDLSISELCLLVQVYSSNGGRRVILMNELNKRIEWGK